MCLLCKNLHSQEFSRIVSLQIQPPPMHNEGNPRKFLIYAVCIFAFHRCCGCVLTRARMCVCTYQHVLTFLQRIIPNCSMYCVLHWAFNMFVETIFKISKPNIAFSVGIWFTRGTFGRPTEVLSSFDCCVFKCDSLVQTVNDDVSGRARKTKWQDKVFFNMNASRQSWRWASNAWNYWKHSQNDYYRWFVIM